MTSDIYRTIKNPSQEILYKEKNSKFYGYGFPVKTENEVKPIIDNLKKKHYAARHWCYAYQIGIEHKVFRANDDGEPNNSAGMPIYGQILSFDVTNILIVVVRYFGGTKLGVGGLINAYKSAAEMTLKESVIVERTINTNYRIKFDYKNMDKVMRIIKELKLNIISQKLEMDCEIEISVRKKDSELVYSRFKNLFEVSICSL